MEAVGGPLGELSHGSVESCRQKGGSPNCRGVDGPP